MWVAVGGTTGAWVGEAGWSSDAPEHAATIKIEIAMIAIPMIETSLSRRNRLLKFSNYSGFEKTELSLNTRLDYIKGSTGRIAVPSKARRGYRFYVWLSAFGVIVLKFGPFSYPLQ